MYYFLTSFAIFLLAGWDCIQQFILKIDGAGRLPFWFAFLLLLFLVITNSRVRKMQFTSPNIWMWLLCIYMVLNTLRMGISPVRYSSSDLFFYHNVTPFFLYALVFLTGGTERKRSLAVIICSMYMSCLFFLVNTSRGQWGAGINSTMRLSSESLNSNFLSFYAVASFYVLLFYYSKYGMNKILFWAGGLLSTIIVFQTASRTGYICLCVLLVFTFIRNMKITGSKIVLFILLAILLYFVNSWIMKNTSIGYRFSMREYEADRVSYVTNTILDDIFGERIVYFIVLMDIFPEYPFWGVGAYNFIEHNKINNCVCHNEYIRHLAEGGLVGFILFAVFFVSVWKRLLTNLRRYPERRSMLRISMAGILCVMFGYMGIYSMPMMQIMLALAAAEIFSDEESGSQTGQKVVELQQNGKLFSETT